jgi:DNA-binding response OmpR family regulator
MARILLIEPDAVLSKIYHQVLVSVGHAVHVSRSAQHGIFTTDEIVPELIILELQLIGHSGIEFLYELRSYSDWKRIPVVVMSHVPPQEFSGSASLLKHTLGVREYFYKPQTSLSSLLATVKRLTLGTADPIVTT